MKLFRENPPKAVFWYGFGLVCIILLVGMGYFAYIVSNEKPETVENKKAISGPTSQEIAAAEINATIAGKLVSVTDKSLVLSVGGKNLTFTHNQTTAYSKGVTQIKGDFKDLKPGMAIALGYNKETKVAYNVSY